MTDMSLDESFLHYQGGVEKNSLIHILEPDIDADDNQHDEPDIIHHSPYYDFEKLTPILAKHKKSFSIFSTNIQSIKSKFAQFCIFLKTLSKLDFAFSVICIQESWLSDNDDYSQFQLEGYKCIPQGQSCSSKGGLTLYQK